MHLMSAIGSAAFYLPLIAVLYWCVDPRLAARLTVILSLSSVVNTVLKLVFHDPRPYWTDPSVKGHEPIESFGMPSGHAQNAVAVWGFLATRARRALWPAPLLVIVLIGVSRVQLGVHSAGQVMVGWAIGAGLLAAALVLEPKVVPWWAARPLPLQIAMALAVSLVPLGVAWVAVHSLQDWTWPQAWADAIVRAGGDTRPIDLEQAAAATGGLFGLVSGVCLLASRGWFDPGGTRGRRLARLPVGAAGAAVLALPDLFIGGHPFAIFVVQASLGLWSTFGAPEAFVRLGLAERAPRPAARAGEGRTAGRQ